MSGAKWLNQKCDPHGDPYASHHSCECKYPQYEGKKYWIGIKPSKNVSVEARNYSWNKFNKEIIGNDEIVDNYINSLLTMKLCY